MMHGCGANDIEGRPAFTLENFRSKKEKENKTVFEKKKKKFCLFVVCFVTIIGKELT